MNSVSCNNTHHDVTDLVNHEMVKNTKTRVSREQNITFVWNKKILNLCLRWHILWSLLFCCRGNLSPNFIISLCVFVFDFVKQVEYFCVVESNYKSWLNPFCRGWNAWKYSYVSFFLLLLLFFVRLSGFFYFLLSFYCSWQVLF